MQHQGKKKATGFLECKRLGWRSHIRKNLLDADKRGFSIQPEFLRGMAQILLCERTQDLIAVLGVNWAYSFTKRRPELRTRYN
jgi:hypothetical protein